MHKKISTVFLAVTLTCTVFPVASAGGASRIALRADVLVPGDAIFLSQLLPAEVPAEVREAARAVWLGKAPQNGSARSLRGAAVAEAIRRSGLAGSDFIIPEFVFIQRLERPLSGEEILASVRGAMAHFSGSAREESALLALQAGDINLESGLRVPLGDAGLKVQGISVNLPAAQARIRMTAASEVAGVPFEILATLRTELPPGPGIASEDFQQAASHSPLRGARKGAKDADSADELPLVVAGQVVRLRLRSENSRIFLEGKALQDGYAGETIRVRLSTSGRTLQARVSGERELQADF